MKILINSSGVKLPSICNECFACMWGSCSIAPAEVDGNCINGRKPDWCPLSVMQSEMDLLEKYLKEHGIKYNRYDKDKIVDERGFVLQNELHKIEVLDEEGEYQWDAICHYGSYGYGKGLLEIYGNIVTEDDGDSVVGWLTAQDVIDRIKS